MRVVSVPSVVVAELIAHMEGYSGPRPDDWVFTADEGGPAREADLGRAWRDAAALCGLNARMHDLRHFGGTAAAQSGATLRELQERLGHSTARAAMIYKHAAEEDRDRTIADRMGDGLDAALDAAQARQNVSDFGVPTQIQPRSPWQADRDADCSFPKSVEQVGS